MEQKIFNGVFHVKFDLLNPNLFDEKELDINKVILTICEKINDEEIALTPPNCPYEKYYLIFKINT